MLTRKEAMALTKRLDKIANHVQDRYQEMGLSRKAAHDFCLYLDETSDRLERSAKTLQREPDEPYMDTFDGPMETHEMEPDEPYMRHFDDDNDAQLVDDPDLTPMNDGKMASDNWYTRESSSNWYEAGDDDWY